MKSRLLDLVRLMVLTLAAHDAAAYEAITVNDTQTLPKYDSGADSNVIEFAVSVTNQYVGSSPVAAVVNVWRGVPSYIATLVDSTNFSAATWSAYTSSNISVAIGSTAGPHDIWVGLRGLPSDAKATWDETTVILDSGSPTISITNPVGNVSMNSLRVNVCGNFTCASLEQITVNGVIAFTNGTNFEARNVPLISGTNSMTAVVQDFDGVSNSATIFVMGVTNSDGSLNDPVELQVSPVGGFFPLPVTFQVQTNLPGMLSSVLYDFNGDGITDFATNNIAALTYTYPTNGEFFPVITVQTSSGRFSSFGGWNAATLFPDEALSMVNVQAPPVLMSSISTSDPVDLKWVAPSNLYVLSKRSATITQFSTNGTTIRYLSGIGANPSGLAVDALGRVYVAITGNNQVRRYYPTNSTFAADASFGTNGFLGLTNGASGAGAAQFNAPFDVAVSPDGGTISVSDSGNNRIQQFDSSGNFIAAFGAGAKIGSLNAPCGLAYDSVGDLYIVDSGNNRVLVAILGMVIGASGTNGNALGQFHGPINVSVSTRGIYLADAGNNRVQVFAPYSGLGTAPAPFYPRVAISRELGLNNPAAVAAVPNFLHEYVYVADTGNNRILLINLPLDDPSSAWTNMTNHVVSGDATGALQYFSRLYVEEYREVFLGTGTNTLLPLISSIPSITPSVIENKTAEFSFTNVIDGQTITFPIEFIRENGVWKISEF